MYGKLIYKTYSSSLEEEEEEEEEEDEEEEDDDEEEDLLDFLDPGDPGGFGA